MLRGRLLFIYLMMKLPIVISWLLFWKMRLYAAATASVKVFGTKHWARIQQTFMKCVATVKNSILQPYFLSRGIMPSLFPLCVKWILHSSVLLHQSDNCLHSLKQCVCSQGERWWVSVAHGLHIGEFHVVPIMFLLTLTCTEVTYRPTQTPTPQYRTDSLVSCSEICWSSHAG